MNENNSPIPIKDITEIAKATKELLPQTANETDGALSTLVGWFNNFVLYPVKKANITYRYKLECFEDDLRKKAEEIPKDKFCEPSLMIAGPTLEALKYSYDVQELREMYINLLATSMNSDKTVITHPSFVDIIKQMDAIDAKLFYHISKARGNIKAINPNISIVGTNKVFVDATPEWFFGWLVPDCTIFQTSASLIRLSRLGLVKLMFDRTAGKEGYEILQQFPLLMEILEIYKRANPSTELALTDIKSVFYVNEFGKQFAACCLC